MTDATFAGKVAIVTGAAHGIGLCVATRLAERGARVALVDKDAEAAAEAASSLADAFAVPADVSREEDVINYVNETVDVFGRVDLFFNNAGIAGRIAPITELTLEDFEKAGAVNVRGTFLGLREVLRVMERQGTGGAIVNTASTSSVRATPGTAPYVATKHAVLGLTKAAALDAAPYDVRVNAIAPGATDTRMMQEVQQARLPDDPDAFFATFRDRVPLGRLGRPEEIASLVTWLLSSESSFVTGSLYLIDGGLRAS